MGAVLAAPAAPADRRQDWCATVGAKFEQPSRPIGVSERPVRTSHRLGTFSVFVVGTRPTRKATRLPDREYSVEASGRLARFGTAATSGQIFHSRYVPLSVPRAANNVRCQRHGGRSARADSAANSHKRRP